MSKTIDQISREAAEKIGIKFGMWPDVSDLTNEIAAALREYAEQQEKENREQAHFFRELMAIMHSDGGHYLAANGNLNSYERAIEIWHDRYQRMDKAEHEYDKLKASLEKAEEDMLRWSKDWVRRSELERSAKDSESLVSLLKDAKWSTNAHASFCRSGEAMSQQDEANLRDLNERIDAAITQEPNP